MKVIQFSINIKTVYGKPGRRYAGIQHFISFIDKVYQTLNLCTHLTFSECPLSLADLY